MTKKTLQISLDCIHLETTQLWHLMPTIPTNPHIDLDTSVELEKYWANEPSIFIGGVILVHGHSPGNLVQEVPGEIALPVADSFREHCRGLVLGCINADFCNQILILQRFSRSTKWASWIFKIFAAKFCKILQNSGEILGFLQNVLGFLIFLKMFAIFWKFS